MDNAWLNGGGNVTTIGVLAIQGAFSLHRTHIEALGAKYAEVSEAAQFAEIDGLILPGGESGAMLKLLAGTSLEAALIAYLADKPVWGICAGGILMARAVTGPAQRSFGILDVVVERNAYGRQCDSMNATVDGYRVAYIRAPRIIATGEGVTVRARRDGNPCWVESGPRMATTFHPEVNTAVPSPWHQRLAAFC